MWMDHVEQSLTIQFLLGVWCFTLDFVFLQRQNLQLRHVDTKLGSLQSVAVASAIGTLCSPVHVGRRAFTNGCSLPNATFTATATEPAPSQAKALKVQVTQAATTKAHLECQHLTLQTGYSHMNDICWMCISYAPSAEKITRQIQMISFTKCLSMTLLASWAGVLCHPTRCSSSQPHAAVQMQAH